MNLWVFLLTGNKIEVKGFDLVRFVNGKAVEHWGVADMAKLMQQLGTIPQELTETGGK